MPSSASWPCRLALAAICFVAILPWKTAASVAYCSNINTSSNQRNASMFQSNGLCSDFCRADYAFAIVQFQGCWCSNYAPSSGAASLGCITPCPGYPSEICGGGDTDPVAYAYIGLINPVSGTRGPSSTSATPIAQTTLLQTFVATTEYVSILVAVTPDESPIRSSSTRSTTGTTNDATSTWTPTPTVSLQTLPGETRTITVTPSAPPNASSTVSPVESGSRRSGGLSTGAAVGLTIGLVALVAIIGSIIYFCWQRRKKEKNAQYDDVGGVPGHASGEDTRTNTGSGTAVVPSRTMSESSRYVLTTDGRRVVEGWENEKEPISRRSRLIAVDPRLDPYAGPYQRAADDARRNSINTIKDHEDYSRRLRDGLGNIHGRPLRTVNPDPEGSS